MWQRRNRGEFPDAVAAECGECDGAAGSGSGVDKEGGRRDVEPPPFSYSSGIFPNSFPPVIIHLHNVLRDPAIPACRELHVSQLFSTPGMW